MSPTPGSEGCGQVACQKNGIDRTIMVCNCDPRGNVMGERVY